jgi:hypothetical protein
VLRDVAATGLSGGEDDRTKDVGQSATLFCTTRRRAGHAMEIPVGILVTTGHSPADLPHEAALQSGLVYSYQYVTVQVRAIFVEW